MRFIPSSHVLRPYVKGYFALTVNQNINNQIFFPSGFIDIAINISEGSITTIIGDRRIRMPKVEVLGQLVVPTRLDITQGTSILVARIFPYANSLFFPNPIADFTNDSLDLRAVLSNEVDELYDKLTKAINLEEKIEVLDGFFIQKLIRNESKLGKASMIAELCNSVSREAIFDLRRTASQFGLSTRHVERLFESTVGLTPRLFFNTHRFKKSLALVQSSGQPLTSIAHECGYFDQAHFIREFKRFTGITPSQARMLPVVQ